MPVVVAASFIVVVVAIFKAIAAIPAIAGYCEKFAQAIMMWYIERQKNETLAKIADAAALAARANTKEERHAALNAWADALSRPRRSM